MKKVINDLVFDETQMDAALYFKLSADAEDLRVAWNVSGILAFVVMPDGGLTVVSAGTVPGPSELQRIIPALARDKSEIEKAS